MKLKVNVNGVDYDVDVEVEEEPAAQLGNMLSSTNSGYSLTPTAAKAPASAANGLKATISGTVLKINVAEGDEVKAGDTLMLLEAMKMETEVTAPHDGTIATLNVSVGEAVASGQVLLEWAG
jgi:methylmalonyl-CoA carboxyltransferase small subunit